MAQSNATGALLHLIQDSYSQSHVARGAEADRDFVAKIECLPPSRFYVYGSQLEKEHRRADGPPSISSSCSGPRAVDDPVTASAVMLWHIASNSPSEEVRRYLETRVFPSL